MLSNIEMAEAKNKSKDAKEKDLGEKEKEEAKFRHNVQLANAIQQANILFASDHKRLHEGDDHRDALINPPEA